MAVNHANDNYLTLNVQPGWKFFDCFLIVGDYLFDNTFEYSLGTLQIKAVGGMPRLICRDAMTLLQVRSSLMFSLDGFQIMNCQQYFGNFFGYFFQFLDMFGGGLDLSDVAEAVVNNTIFYNNSSPYNGGAIASTNVTTLTVENCSFTANSGNKTMHKGLFLAQTGGAVFLNRNRNVLFSNSTWSSNTAGDSGGCILSQNDITSNLTISHCKFNSNYALTSTYFNYTNFF